jgi:hypothetical protein
VRAAHAILILLTTAPVSAADGELTELFRSPPAEFRPLPILHSMPLNRDDAIPRLGTWRVGGAVIDVGVTPGSKSLGREKWNNPTYLKGPDRLERLRHVVARMKKDGLEVWLYDELGYPSASAGGRMLDGHPEFQVQVVGCRTISVDAASHPARRAETG